MNQITRYLITVLTVFVFLTAVFLVLVITKFIIKAKKNDFKGKLAFRGKPEQIDINKNIHNLKHNSYRNIDESPIKGEKIYKYDNGDVYKGEFINEKRNGFGVCIFNNKERYEGLWKDDKMHCVGKYTYNDGSVYSGDFKHGLIEGMGRYRYANEEIYKGYFINNKRNGKGSLYYRDGSKYIGMWENDAQCGEGKLTKPNGDVYKGEFKDGKFNGKGEYTFLNGSKYTGEFKDNVYHGHGCYVEINGDIYEGEYRYGCKRGYGILKTRSNGTYDGEFKDDLFNGRGRYTYMDKSIYEGDFKDHKRDGIGTYICQSYKYIGEWKHDAKGQVGSYYLSSQVVIDVIIENNKITEGIYKFKDEEEQYLYNIELSNEEYIFENIETYLKRKNKKLEKSYE
ncbi:hypothetical protein [Romboutsia sp.]|uniref:hypothetical protein n=1 Tax=Romboutsia sp. TaxID=1965302 RepID=UPI003F2AB21F